MSQERGKTKSALASMDHRNNDKPKPKPEKKFSSTTRIKCSFAIREDVLDLIARASFNDRMGIGETIEKAILAMHAERDLPQVPDEHKSKYKIIYKQT